jgi:hypothetical protein
MSELVMSLRLFAAADWSRYLASCLVVVVIWISSVNAPILYRSFGQISSWEPLVNVFLDYEVTATDFNTAAWFVYPSRTYIPLKVRVFIDLLKNSIPC